jgi:AcrR family transcriptional regulator
MKSPAAIPEEEPADAPAPPHAETAEWAAGISRNLNGQKLGRKGRDTRLRIINAAAEIVADPSAGPVSLSAVARRVSLGMTSIYLYFNDLTELLLAVFEPAMAEAEEAFVWRLRERWPDAELSDRCRTFIADYFAFWQRHSRVLHLRNSMADQHDRRMMEHRIAFATPIIALLVGQMDRRPDDGEFQAVSMASMLMTGIERSATIWSDPELPKIIDGLSQFNADRFRVPAARLLELGIRDGRAKVRAA